MHNIGQLPQVPGMVIIRAAYSITFNIGLFTPPEGARAGGSICHKKIAATFWDCGFVLLVGVEGFDASRRIFILFYGLRPPGCARCLLRKLHCLIPSATRFAFCTAPRGGEGRGFDCHKKITATPLGLRLRFARGR